MIYGEESYSDNWNLLNIGTSRLDGILFVGEEESNEAGLGIHTCEEYLIIGAPYYDIETDTPSGAIYVIDRDDIN